MNGLVLTNALRNWDMAWIMRLDGLGLKELGVQGVWFCLLLRGEGIIEGEWRG